MCLRFMSSDHWKLSPFLQQNVFNWSFRINSFGWNGRITYIKIENNYSKYTFSDSMSQNVQPIRNNESNIKY